MASIKVTNLWKKGKKEYCFKSANRNFTTQWNITFFMMNTYPAKNVAVALKQGGTEVYLYTSNWDKADEEKKCSGDLLILQWKSSEYTFSNTPNFCKGQVSSTHLIMSIFYVLWHMITFESLHLLTCICISRLFQFSLCIFLICNSAFIIDRDLQLTCHREVPRVQIYPWNYTKNKLDHGPQRNHSQGYELLARVHSFRTLVISIYFSST